MAQKLLNVKTQLKSAAHFVGQVLARIDDHVHILDLESQKVHECFSTQVTKRLGQTDERQTRHDAVTSQLHQAVQATQEQSMH